MSEPDPKKFEWDDPSEISWVDDDDDDEVTEALTEERAAEAGGEQLKHYWTKGEGLAKWAKSPHPWTALYKHLKKYMADEMAKRTAAQWFHDTFGIWPGERGGKNPLGKG